MGTTPLVSIIIPNRNKAKFIRSTILSALAQSYNNIEVLVIDDGSTDESRIILDELQLVDSRLRWYPCPKKLTGGSAARNYGLGLSKGEYILFLDSDDKITPNCIAGRMSQFMGSDLAFAVFPIGTFYDEVGDSSSLWITTQRHNHLLQFLRHRLPWNTMAVLWSREALNQLDGFDENYQRLQDVELHTRALIAQLPYRVFSNSPVDAYYRISSSRWDVDIAEMCSRYFESSVRYSIESMHIAGHSLPSLSQKKIKKALQRTILSMIFRICLEVQSGNIDKFQAEKQISGYLDRCQKQSILTSWTKLYAKHFTRVALTKSVNIRGFQRVFLSEIAVCH